MKNTSIAVASLGLAALCGSNSAGALNIREVEFNVQPRLETGLLYYDYQQDGLTATLASTAQQFGGNFVQESFRFKDTMFFVGGGLTAFVDRFFIDLSALTTLTDGEDGDSVAFSQFAEGAGGPGNFASAFLSTDADFNADFDRDEYAISLGYGVTEQLAVFAGYKWAKTDFKTEGEGSFGILATPDVVGVPPLDRDNFDGDFRAEVDFELEYDGPFVGINYGLDVNTGFLNGTLAFNFAAAFLDGDTDVKSDNQSFVVNTVDGVPIPPTDIDLAQPVSVEIDGDTVGLTFGVGWRGFTPINGLTYALNVSGYKYEFDAGDSDIPGGEAGNFDETAVTFKVGVAYAF